MPFYNVDLAGCSDIMNSQNCKSSFVKRGRNGSALIGDSVRTGFVPCADLCCIYWSIGLRRVVLDGKRFNIFGEVFQERL